MVRVIASLLLTKPALLVGGGLAVYTLVKQNRQTGKRLRDAKLELIEQQRALDRLRAEVGRERELRRTALPPTSY